MNANVKYDLWVKQKLNKSEHLTFFKHVVLEILFVMSAEKRIFPYIANWREEYE